MAKPIDAARYETSEASYPSYDDMLHMMAWQAHNRGPHLWVDDAIDEITCAALTELTGPFSEWSGIDPADRHAI